MNPEAYSLLEMMKKLAPDRAVSPDEHEVVPLYQTRYMAKLMVVLAEEQEKAAAKLEAQTDRLVTQTNRLVSFTKGLYLLTIALLVLGVIQLVTSCHHS